MLRINVSVPLTSQDGYVVPPDNPFRPGNPLGALPEIWAFGLRNPWKFSFDSPPLGGTGALFIGDVGQNSWEEVDYQPPGVGGRNYGWRNREGAHPNPHVLVGGDLPPAYFPLFDPIVEYPHPVGASVIGGVVYRGSAMRPTYRGRYFYGDLNGRVWSVGIVPLAGGEAAATPPVEHTDEFGGTGYTGLLSAIGTDAAGEMYFLNYSLGQVLKMVDSGSVWVPPAADFNRDHKPDLIWFHEGSRQLAAWNMGGGVVGEKLLAGYFLSAPSLPPGWQVVGAGDVDGDGNTDLFLQSEAGLLAVCFFDGLVFRAGLNFNGVADPLWRVRAVGDFNHDGHPDLVWQNATTGQVVFWLMNGVNLIGYGIPNVASPGPDWQVFGTGDSNLDGERDLFWQHRTLGLLAVWRMIGTEYLGGLLLSASPDASWKAVATCDLNQDGSTDIVFQHTSTLLAAWYLSGETVSFGALLNPQNIADPQWKIVGPR
jgi:hypothetical protein